LRYDLLLCLPSLSEQTGFTSSPRGRLLPGFRRFGRPRRRRISLQRQLGNLRWRDFHPLDHQLASLHRLRNLSATLVYTKAIFIGENGPNCRIAASLRRHRMSCSLAATGLVTAAVNVKFSVSPPTGTRLVYSGRRPRFGGTTGSAHSSPSGPARNDIHCLHEPCLIARVLFVRC
jgi:hypothetical protein